MPIPFSTPLSGNQNTQANSSPATPSTAASLALCSMQLVQLSLASVSNMAHITACGCVCPTPAVRSLQPPSRTTPPRSTRARSTSHSTSGPAILRCYLRCGILVSHSTRTPALRKRGRGASWCTTSGAPTDSITAAQRQSPLTRRHRCRACHDLVPAAASSIEGGHRITSAPRLVVERRSRAQRSISRTLLFSLRASQASTFSLSPPTSNAPHNQPLFLF